MKSDLASSWTSLRIWLAQRRWQRRLRLLESRQADFRDRISVASWPIVLGLALSNFFSLPTYEFSFVAFGSPATVPLTGGFLVAMFLAALAAAGTESVVSAHPNFATAAQRTEGRTWPFWALPMAFTVIVAVLLPRAPTPLLQVLGLLGTAVMLITAFYALYLTVEVGQPGFRRARLILNVLTYLSAVVLFLFVYQTRTRSLVSGSLIAVIGALLTIELLRSSTGRTSTVLAYGMIVGLILGEVTWALNYWPVPDITGGLVLLLIFYLLVGSAQQGLQGRLTRRVVLEYVAVAVLSLLFIYLLGPGFSVFAAPGT